jgi:hypothetical protein
MKNDFYLGDLYPNLGYMTTRATTIPEPADQVVMTQKDQDLAAANPLDVDQHDMRNHYFALIIVCGTILLLGIR